MSKWLVALIVVGVVAGLLVGLGIGFFDSEEADVDRGPVPEAAVDTGETEVELPASWDGLSLSRFLDQASGALVVRNPEAVTSLGLGDALGIGNSQLTPLSSAYEQETARFVAAVLERLGRYNLADVSGVDRLDARIYGWFLRNLVDDASFADHQYLVHPFITSYPQTLERFLLATHPIRSDQDAVDYVSRLSQVAERYDELIARTERSRSIGAIPPRFILEETIGDLRQSADTTPTASPVYTGFVSRLGRLGLAQARADELAGMAEVEIERSVLPAYRRLLAYVEGLLNEATDEGGVWRHEDGDAYYAHLLRSYTTTDLTADEIHEIGLAEVERIRAEIDALASTLGFAPGTPLVDLFAELADRDGSVSGEEARALCEGLLDDITARIEPAFSRMPRQKLRVVGGSTDAFYSPGSLDGSRPGLFYAPTEVETPRHEIPTVTYHEAIPGHHFQISIAHEADIAVYRSGISFTAYAEGWALYAERLAWEFGAYEDDSAGDLGRLQAELFRAARLVVDTGIHAFRWTYEDAVSYMIENTGLEESFVRSEVVRYIVLPGQATAYKIGMLRFLELRRRAKDALGDAFALPEFHERVLREGSVPLEILGELVEAYIAECESEI